MVTGIRLQAEAIQTAPLIFVAAVLVACLLIWAIVHFLYRHRIDGLRDELDRERRENSRLREPSMASYLSNGLANLKVRSEERSLPNLPRVSRNRVLTQIDDKVFLGSGVSFSYLSGLYADKTDYQADRLVETYLGKWMTVEGTVRNARFSGEVWSLNVEPAEMEDSLFFVSIDFDVSETAKLEILHKGDKVIAHGRLKAVSRHWVDLECGYLA